MPPQKKANEFSVHGIDEPDVAQAAVLNSDALHPENLLHTGIEDKSFLKGGKPQATVSIFQQTHNGKTRYGHNEIG